MAKTQVTNMNGWTTRFGLMWAGLLVFLSGCAGPWNTEPGPSWQGYNEAPSIVEPATAPSRNDRSTKTTVRGQGGWDGDDTVAGSDDHLRYPMPASGPAGDASPDNSAPRGPARVAYQPTTYPPAGTPGVGPPAVPGNVPVGGSPAPTGDNGQWLTSPFLNPQAPGYVPAVDQLPGTPVPLDIMVEEARTGHFMFGAGINSDAGVTGQITVDERNFDLFGFPHSWSDVWNGEAFRGRGQGFRLEAMPGNRVQRYLVSFTEPYLMATQLSLNVSAFLYDRNYYDWDESRVGGRIGLGYRLTPDLSATAGLRMEDVKMSDPRIRGVPQLEEVLGSNDFYSGRLTLRHDTRDLPFLPTEGHLIELSFEQAFGEFDYPRAEFDYRRYFLVRERPDGSGRHTLSAGIGAGFSGADTPLFENYFAGGFSTLRGWSFRGASPVENSVTVGGTFRTLGSVEYVMPLTADDMIKAVAFVDFGTVEKEITINADNFRVAPGFGFRVSVPALGPAPLAFDFAFPVAQADTDDTQVFSFFFGIGRG